MMKPHKATGHYDRAGVMIHRHDCVLVGAEGEKCRPAYVLLQGRNWILWYGEHKTESINNHGAERLLVIPPKKAQKRA